MRRARRGGTEAPFVISARKKEKKKKRKVYGGHVSDHPECHLAPPLCSAAVRHRDTGSPRGSPLRSRSAGASATPYTSRRSHLGACLGPRAGARAEASSRPACPVGTTKITGSRLPTRRGDPTASSRTFADAPLLARTLPRSDPIPPPSARGVDRCSISCLGGRLRPRASSSRAPRFRRCSDGVLGKRVPSERNLPISARRICARSSLYGRWASRLSFGAGIEPGLIRIATFGITDRLACRQVFLFSFSNQACIPHTRVNVFARSPACQPPSSSKRP